MEEKIIKKIQELVPEIMELKFGCRVKLNKVYDRDEAIILKIYKDGGSCIFGIDKEINQERPEILFNRKSIGKILGRDIILEDILLAWDKKLRDNWKFGLQEVGMNEKIKSIILTWTWNKPFNEQSKKTKDLVRDLLLTN